MALTVGGINCGFYIKFKVTDNVEADYSSVYVGVFWYIFRKCGENRNRNKTGPSTHEPINSLSLGSCGLQKKT